MNPDAIWWLVCCFVSGWTFNLAGWLTCYNFRKERAILPTQLSNQESTKTIFSYRSNLWRWPEWLFEWTLCVGSGLIEWFASGARPAKSRQFLCFLGWFHIPGTQTQINLPQKGRAHKKKFGFNRFYINKLTIVKIEEYR